MILSFINVLNVRNFAHHQKMLTTDQFHIKNTLLY